MSKTILKKYIWRYNKLIIQFLALISFRKSVIAILWDSQVWLDVHTEFHVVVLD